MQMFHFDHTVTVSQRPVHIKVLSGGERLHIVLEARAAGLHIVRVNQKLTHVIGAIDIARFMILNHIGVKSSACKVTDVGNHGECLGRW